MEKPNYGIDAAPVVRNLAVIGSILLVLSVLAFTAAGNTFLVNFKYTFLAPAVCLLVTAALMILYARRGKFRHRDRMLSMINWRGDERVLDVGTGRGLLMIGAAKKLTSGKSIGIDIWNSADLSGNKIENTRRNATLENVAAKIEILEENAMRMSFADASFDVVLSNLCLHNIPDEEDRRTACREIARVLKPGGVILISDFQSTKLYDATFQNIGLQTELSAPFLLDTFPPLRILKAKK